MVDYCTILNQELQIIRRNLARKHRPNAAYDESPNYDHERRNRASLLCSSKNMLRQKFVVSGLVGTPRMLHDLSDSIPLVHLAIEHRLDEIDRGFAHDPRNAQLVVHNLIDAVEWILFVDKGVKQDAKGPDILLLASIRFTLQNFGCGVILYADV